MDPKFSNGKKHRDKKHQRETTTDLIIDDEQLLMQQQQNHRHSYDLFNSSSNRSGRFTNENMSNSSDQLNINNSHLDIDVASKKKWKCMQCTYENWPSALKCTLCLNSKASSQTSNNNNNNNTSTSLVGLSNSGGGIGHVKSNRNSLKKINSFKNNNYNIYEPSSIPKNNGNNFNRIEILPSSYDIQHTSSEDMVSVDANIGKMPY